MAKDRRWSELCRALLAARGRNGRNAKPQDDERVTDSLCHDLWVEQELGQDEASMVLAICIAFTVLPN